MPESSGDVHRTHLFDVVVGDQAHGLVFVFDARLLLCFPPVVFVALLENVEQISFVDLKLAFGLRSVVVHSLVDAEKRHCSGARRLRGGEVGEGSVRGVDVKAPLRNPGALGFERPAAMRLLNAGKASRRVGDFVLCGLRG